MVVMYYFIFFHILQLRVGIVLAVGQISYILSQSQLSDLLPRLIPGIMMLYKKHADQLPITEVIFYTCLILSWCVYVSEKYL